MSRWWAIAILLTLALQLAMLFIPGSCEVPTSIDDPTWWSYIWDASTGSEGLRRATAGLATAPALAIAFFLWVQTQTRARFFHQAVALLSIPAVIILITTAWDDDVSMLVGMMQSAGVIVLILFACGLLWHARYATPGNPADPPSPSRDVDA